MLTGTTLNTQQPRTLRIAFTQPAPTALHQRAARLYPDSDYLQREWLRAVAVVRSTRNGWHLDKPVERRQ